MFPKVQKLSLHHLWSVYSVVAVQPGLHICLSCRHFRASAHLYVVECVFIKDQDCVLRDIRASAHLYVVECVFIKDQDCVLRDIRNQLLCQPSPEVLVVHFRMIVAIRASCLKYELPSGTKPCSLPAFVHLKI